MSTFTARYHGRCAACDDGIEPGDVLTYDEDDVVIHADCTESAIRASPGKALEICPRCFLAKSASGDCGCT